MSVSPQTSADYMAIAMARLLVDTRTVFHGLASPLPAVAIALARALHNPGLVYLNIAGGVNSHSSGLSISTCAPSFLDGSESFFSLTDIFDLSARGKLDTAFLGGVQIDREGRINNSVIGDFSRPKVRLPGGAGSAAIVPTARRTIVWRTRHDTRSFVEKCDFVTAAGNVREVVTPMGTLVVHDGELRLRSWFEFTSPSSIRENTGFDLKNAPGASEDAPPTEEELDKLNLVDRTGVRHSEFGIGV